MRAAPVVRHDLRDGPGLREQLIDHPHRSRAAARLARSDDGVQPGPVGAQGRQIRLARAPAHPVATGERGHVRHGAQLVTAGGPAGVDQLGRGDERLEQVSTKALLTADRLLS